MAASNTTRRKATPAEPAIEDGLKVVYGKVPPRRVSGDDYFEDSDGCRYYSHHGEWIDFSPQVGIDTVLMAQNLSYLFQQFEAAGGEEEAPEEMADAIREALAEVSRVIHGAIRRWSWTDGDGQPFPERPSLEDVASLPLNEILFLANNAFGNMAQEGGEGRVKS